MRKHINHLLKSLLLFVFCGVIIFVVYWSIRYRSNHPLGIFTPNIHHSIESNHQNNNSIHKENYSITTYPIVDSGIDDDIDQRIIEQATHKYLHDKIQGLTNRKITANVGQYSTAAAARLELPKLKKYLNDCVSNIYGHAICQGLSDSASVREMQWTPGEDKYIYFLIIENLDDPTFYALCDYMWNAERLFDGKQWARENYHRCANFSQWKDDP